MISSKNVRRAAVAALATPALLVGGAATANAATFSECTTSTSEFAGPDGAGSSFDQHCVESSSDGVFNDSDFGDSDGLLGGLLGGNLLGGLL